MSDRKPRVSKKYNKNIITNITNKYNKKVISKYFSN